MKTIKRLIYGAAILAVVLGAGYFTALWLTPATLKWTPNGPQPEGYRLFRRFAGEVYDYSAPVYQGPKLRFVAECPADKTCFWVVRAYKGAKESENSNEVSLSGPKHSPP
jgi:hypothetical protein